MLTKDEIAAEIIRLIGEQIGTHARKITAEAKFHDDLGFDSIDDVEMVMEVEDRFGLDISDEEAEKIKTVGQAAAFVHARLGATP